MTDERICPVCEKPVTPECGVYRVGKIDYHRECYEKRKPESVEPDRDA
jgi:hypothetical protein